MKKKSNKLRFIFSFIIIFAISFLSLEILLSFKIKLPSPYHLKDPRLVYDDRGFWINIPNSNDIFNNNTDFINNKLTILSNGLRKTECYDEKDYKDNFNNIFLIGDSQLFGWGLDDKDTIPSKLSCRLKDDDLKFRVINLGVWGTNIDQYLMRLSMFVDFKKKNDKYIFLITWNDWHSSDGGVTVPNKSSKCPSEKNTKNDIFTCINKNPNYYGKKNDFRRRIYNKTGLFVPVFSDLKTLFYTLSYTSKTFYIILPLVKNFYLKFRNYNFEELLVENSKKNGKLLKKINDYIGKDNDVVFIFLPPKISYIDDVYKIYSQNGKIYPTQDFLYYLANSECKKYKLKCYSVFKKIRTKSPGKVEFKYDGHLNTRGSEIISNFIYDLIKDSK